VVAILSQELISVPRGGGNRWWMQLNGFSNLREKLRQSLARPS